MQPSARDILLLIMGCLTTFTLYCISFFARCIMYYALSITILTIILISACSLILYKENFYQRQYGAESSTCSSAEPKHTRQDRKHRHTPQPQQQHKRQPEQRQPSQRELMRTFWTQDYRLRSTVMLANPESMDFFPEPPPMIECRKAHPSCRDEERLLKCCPCDVKSLFELGYRESGIGVEKKQWLKVERRKWHPDRFSRCGEAVREEYVGKATEMFQVLGWCVEQG
ncbi:hypothetical protein LTS18_011117 [Coniosporium uncinatum]|uniref:Uncharacterized protein n=1 Tax=Coniosporium uncinatum TaxID=93489 RepID=A0ACC3DA12_9PEZI|nr:hypothetical protein LTS18_011117 [Coniosporium uncinatum]